MTERISAIVPVHNGVRYLAAALDSIAAQTRAADELIVVDDGSTDGSGALAAAHALAPRVVTQARAGAGAARNAGLALATGERIAFLDADDLWTVDHLSVLGAALDESPGAAMAFGHLRQFVSPDLGPEEAARLMVPDGPEVAFIAGGMLAHRRVFAVAGTFDESLRVAEFVAWFIRARDEGLTHVLKDDVVLHRRLHATNMGRTHTIGRLEYVRVVRAAMHRRRMQDSGK